MRFAQPDYWFIALYVVPRLADALVQLRAISLGSQEIDFSHTHAVDMLDNIKRIEICLLYKGNFLFVLYTRAKRLSVYKLIFSGLISFLLFCHLMQNHYEALTWNNKIHWFIDRLKCCSSLKWLCRRTNLKLFEKKSCNLQLQGCCLLL